jgi:2-polyprenyl-6-hydroxyphenyl methylase/3-demethylubiquinone-9 3-methyltransferase
MISTHEAEVASRFDALHGRFKPTVASDDFRLRAVLEAIGPLRGLQILDLGCGKGRFTRFLHAEGASVAGVDLSAAMLAEATGVDRVRASARRLPFRPCAFDAVIAIEVFEHLDRTLRRSALAEARRVLRPGAAIVIVDKNIASLNVHRPWLPSVAAVGCIPAVPRFVNTGSGRRLFGASCGAFSRMSGWFISCRRPRERSGSSGTCRRLV